MSGPTPKGLALFGLLCAAPLVQSGEADWPTYNTTIRMLKNTQPKGRADFGEAVVAYAFQRGAESIYCLWTEWSIGKAVRLKGPVQPVRLVDIMGNEQTVKAQDGAVAITLKDTFPVFIVSPADLTPVK